MNNDVVFELLMHLPVRFLLRFRAVCKLWNNIIDSAHFRKMHSLRRNNNKDEEVCLQFISRKIVSINLLDNGKSLKSHDFFPYDLRVSGAVKGLVCISSRLVHLGSHHTLNIAICNPFLGQFKILPLSPYSTTQFHRELFCHHNVGLGFDEDYKVVQLLPCLVHRCLHANLYSARTNSWRELYLDEDELDLEYELIIEKPIKSVCKNGAFVLWQVRTGIWNHVIILSFDMRNEVFRTITISSDEVLDGSSIVFAIFANDDCSFVLLVVDSWRLKVYESSGEGSELTWNNVNNVELNYFWRFNSLSSDDIPIWRNDDCVVLGGRGSSEVILYDYRARKFIRRFVITGRSAMEYDTIGYEGSFISP